MARGMAEIRKRFCLNEADRQNRPIYIENANTACAWKLMARKERRTALLNEVAFENQPVPGLAKVERKRRWLALEVKHLNEEWTKRVETGCSVRRKRSIAELMVALAEVSVKFDTSKRRVKKLGTAEHGAKR